MANSAMVALNRKRIQAVEASFGPAGQQLLQAGRVLVGEGQLTKLGRHGPRLKVFFLFSDLLVYGTAIVSRRLIVHQRIVALEDLHMEDLEDGVSMTNQWLIQTPRKSFCVSASSGEEKHAWMNHIRVCQAALAGTLRGSGFAPTWIPDRVSAVCMRCFRKFSAAHRRHHCRKCGFVVCGGCSRRRALIPRIHPTKGQRVCTSCHRHGELAVETEEEELGQQMDNLSTYVYPDPHTFPLESH